MMSIDINSIANLNIHGVNYRCIINRISKSEAINFELSRFVKKIWFLLVKKVTNTSLVAKMMITKLSNCL